MTRSLRTVLLTLAVLLALVLMLGLARSARAHESRPAFIELRQTGPDQWALTWKVPARAADQRLALRLELPPDVELLGPAQSTYAGGAVVERVELRRTGGLAGVTLRVEGLAATQTDALVRVEYEGGEVEIGRLTPDIPSSTLHGRRRRGELARTYLQLGVEHILTGWDHLLFVACLVLITGVGRTLLLTITGFTVAHSLTFALASLDLVHLPIAPVEATIALSVVFLAAEIVAPNPQSLTLRYPVLVSSAFGLVHGFGFAAVLREIGIPAGELPVALLLFNLGVELGQLLFVLGLVMAALALAGPLQPTSAQRDSLRRAAGYVVGAVAAMWVIERVVAF